MQDLLRSMTMIDSATIKDSFIRGTVSPNSQTHITFMTIESLSCRRVASLLAWIMLSQNHRMIISYWELMESAL